jgi:DNA segregation ATPase FtsK/SpoIIIE, S-DNA-T family
MAERKNGTTKADQTRKAKGKQTTHTKHEKFRLVAGIALLVFTLYLLLAFTSFLFNSGADQSKLQINWIKLITDSSIKVENITGKTGAWLADIFINRWFGLSSYIFLYLSVFYGLNLVRPKPRKLFVRTIKAILAIVWFSVTLGFVFEKWYATSSVYPGGIYGFNIANWLNAMAGKIGTLFILLISLFVFAIFAFDGFLGWLKSQRMPSLKTGNHEGAFIDNEEENAPAETNKTKRWFAGFFGDKEKTPKPKRNNKGTFADEPETESADDVHEQMPVAQKETEKQTAKKPTITIEDNDSEMEIIPLPEDDDDDHIEMMVDVKDLAHEEIENMPMEDYDPTLDLSHYQYPTIDLLDEYSSAKGEVTESELIENKNKIVETLKNFKIEIVKIKATIGPTVTLYEIVPAQGIRISKIKNLEDDIALSLSALGIRIIAPIPGKGTIGIEVPNRTPQMVSMRSIISSRKFQESTAELPVAMGRTISNEIFVFDMTKMPHMLVAGATGQGKSVGLNAIIVSLLYKKHPSQLKFVFVDPKKVELNLYSVIERHFLAKLPDADEPIITDVEKVKATLNSVSIEMDSRYDLLKLAGTRNVKEYNKKFIERRLNPEKGHRFLPYIVVVIDEFADLIMTAGKEVELPIARIAQLARAVGIHMVIATQRPSINIITGVIKANFPSRIAFKVASMIDSRTILDAPGANQLIGKGDMLFASGSEMIRIQCAFVDTPEVENVCQHIANQQAYPTAYLLPEFVGDNGDLAGAIDMSNRDEFLEEAARLVVSNQQGSTSMIQRRFSIGYNRAGRIMDQLEVIGVVGPVDGSKPRRVLLQDEYSLEQLLNRK